MLAALHTHYAKNYASIIHSRSSSGLDKGGQSVYSTSYFADGVPHVRPLQGYIYLERLK